MTDSRDPPAGPNAPPESTPLEHPELRSPATEPAELPAEVPERPIASSSQSRPNGSPGTPRTKPEASRYANSYRPSDADQDPLPTIGAGAYYGFNSGQIDTSADENPDQPPPAYTELPGQISEESNVLGTNAVVADDGRVNIRINEKSRRLSQIFAPQIRHQISQIEREQRETTLPPPYIPEFLGGAPGQEPPPPLNVVIHVVGSRGDVQPFVALGKVLKETYRHRVRLATHPNFKDFVTENGLEFFSIGGDPAELMAFMVKNPGLMPGFDTLRSGDVGKRRRGIAEILRGTWRSCIETGDGLGVDPLKQSIEEWMDIENEIPEELKKPFVADAIIANPPSFGHIHCAEKMGIPLHMMFTMPWSPTQQFPHPLANIERSNADASITNFMSYILVDMLTWQGLGDIINRFRKDTLRLDPISMIWAPAMLARMKIPYTYCWSPALIPKPRDWSPHIQISGFFFLKLAQNYTPALELAEFLAAGEAPIYIGFGSIVVDDPNAMTKMIFEAVKKTGRRALVSKGWGGLGADELGVPEGVFMLGNVPHDWLFKHVACVVHHGGAGTTAAGIAAGRPTVIVPFFGDQPFWGAMVAKAGAGPHPIPYKDLTADKLADSIVEALKPESLERAQEMANKISKETGDQVGAQTFHQMLNYDDLRCAAAPSRAAVWRVKRTQVRLSAVAATVLAQEGELNFSELKLFRSREYETDEGPWDPFTGAATALMGTAAQMMMGVADFPIETLKLLNIHPDSKKGKEPAEHRPEGSSTNSARTGRTTDSRATNHSHVSASSSATTLPGVNTPSSPSTTTPRDGSSVEIPRVATPTSPTTPTTRGTFMAQAMAASSEVSRSRSRSPSRLSERFGSPHGGRPLPHGRAKSISAAELRSESGSSFSDRLHTMNADATLATGKGIGRIVGAGFKSPMDFSLNVARGFHNVPKLYGGEVRQVDKVTDLQSGLRTAAKEFGLGLYEGISGIVTDPYKGAKKEGALGFAKGVGRGIFSVPFRVMGGAFAIPGYAMKGLYQEAMKGKGANVQNYIIAARISQGYDEASTLSVSERADIVSRWKCIRLNVKKKKNPGEEQIESLHSYMKERRKRKEERWNKIKNNSHFKTRPEARPSFPAAMSDSSSYSELPTPANGAPTIHERTVSVDSVLTAGPLPHGSTSAGAEQAPPTRNIHHAATFPQENPSAMDIDLQAAEEEAERREFEQAIQASVAETSRGNPEEDEMIARAIRASVAEFERPDINEEEAMQRALKASIDEATKSGATEEEQKMLEETLKRSLTETRHERDDSYFEWDSSDTEDDEDYQRIIAESKELADLHQAHPQGFDEQTVDEQNEEALKKALEESERAEKERLEQLEKQKTEEDIVMEYVKKQSLMEEEHRRRLIQGRDVHGESSRSSAGPA
ncbi:UDP-Glycosyltransferase/glycogen phosphorylase [Lojkania enalia]|uniref:UDP-Glycosyltransferase/glycogen phosphorylase n=1 Tax=Lojkania enalia TaxID=147567 RepID=A0A9P4N855_9PLEO|nr:UDP-Glycosyltransferase/glycogen phosphorylase [Didymosphaeria enalia]